MQGARLGPKGQLVGYYNRAGKKDGDKAVSEKTDFGERNKRTTHIQSKEQAGNLDDPKSGLVD